MAYFKTKINERAYLKRIKITPKIKYFAIFAKIWGIRFLLNINLTRYITLCYMNLHFHVEEQ